MVENTGRTIGQKVDPDEIDQTKEFEFKSIKITAGADAHITVPSLTTAQRDAMTPAAGMLIFNSDTVQLEQYKDTSWQPMGFGLSGETVFTRTIPVNTATGWYTTSAVFLRNTLGSDAFYCTVGTLKAYLLATTSGVTLKCRFHLQMASEGDARACAVLARYPIATGATVCSLTAAIDTSVTTIPVTNGAKYHVGEYLCIQDELIGPITSINVNNLIVTARGVNSGADEWSDAATHASGLEVWVAYQDSVVKTTQSNMFERCVSAEFSADVFKATGEDINWIDKRIGGVAANEVRFLHAYVEILGVRN